MTLVHLPYTSICFCLLYNCITLFIGFLKSSNHTLPFRGVKLSISRSMCSRTSEHVNQFLGDTSSASDNCNTSKKVKHCAVSQFLLYSLCIYIYIKCDMFFLKSTYTSQQRHRSNVFPQVFFFVLPQKIDPEACDNWKYQPSEPVTATWEFSKWLIVGLGITASCLSIRSFIG